MSFTDSIMQYAAANVAGLSYNASASGGNVFLDALPQSPDTAVAFMSMGGSEANLRGKYQSPTFQVLVRAGADPRVAEALAQTIYNKLHGLSRVSLADGTRLIACIGIQSGPVAIGPDANGRYRFTLNFRTEVHNPGIESGE